QGGGPKTERPGVVAVRWRRGTGTSLGRAREGPDPRTADGWAPLPLRHWEGSPSRRAVDGRADDLALSPYRRERPAGTPALADQRCVGRPRRVDPRKPAELYSGCAGSGRLPPYEQAGDRQTLRPD